MTEGELLSGRDRDVCARRRASVANGLAITAALR
jgi:hypothetical protein